MRISVRNLSKSYNYNKPRRFRAAGLFDIQTPKPALSDVSFDISDGECVGIIGANGSGKSTLLKIICGVTAPTDGKIEVNGRLSALLELGTGFNPEYTGISNIYLNGTVYGLTKSETKALIPEIAAFADIGDYIYRPVKTYSNGMFLRLAFACAVAVKPDILLIDEALAVGDFAFRQKCFTKIEKMKNSGVTVLIVSHDIDAIRRFCPRAIWIDGGKLRMDSDVARVTAAYMESVTGAAGSTAKTTTLAPDSSCINRFGSAVGAITAVSAPPIWQTGNTVEISCSVNIPETADLASTAVSISIKNGFGLDLLVMSTADEGIRFTKHGNTEIRFRFQCNLCAGEYSLCTSLDDRSETPIKYYDYAEAITVFRVVSKTPYFGVFHTPAEMTLYEKEN